MAVKTITTAEKQELLQKRMRLLLELGEQTHLKCRVNAENGALIISLSRQISAVDTELALANQEGFFSRDVDNCPGCKAPVAPGSVFCAECGYAIKTFQDALTAQCGVCGAYGGKEQPFCTVCGNRLESK